MNSDKHLDLEKLIPFLIKAKQKTYAGHGAEVQSLNCTHFFGQFYATKFFIRTSIGVR